MHDNADAVSFSGHVKISASDAATCFNVRQEAYLMAGAGVTSFDTMAAMKPAS